jgi:hypothetical protein
MPISRQMHLEHTAPDTSWNIWYHAGHAVLSLLYLMHVPSRVVCSIGQQRGVCLHTLLQVWADGRAWHLPDYRPRLLRKRPPLTDSTKAKYGLRPVAWWEIESCGA